MNDPFLPAEVRVFVACELPDSWTKALAEASKALSKAGLTYLRWVRPEGIHITLKFLGDVGRHLLPDVAAAMSAGALESSPFGLSLRGLGTFAGHGRPRVLWAGVEGDRPALERLHRQIDAELADLGFARELRPFSPHLTLARVSDNAPESVAGDVTAALRSCRLAEVEPLTVRNVALMRSQLGHGGAAYTRLAAASLGNEQDKA